MGERTLEELISRGEDLNSEFAVPDKQDFSDWIYDVESYLIEEDEYTAEAKELVKKTKLFGLNTNHRYSLLSYLKTMDKLVKPPALPEQPKAFVAMWFNLSMNDIYKEGYKPVVSDNGLECHRIDEIEYNGSIMSHIEDEISESRLFIADLTGNRGGVYYEAGIARGMMLCHHPVKLILTCKADWFHDEGRKPHFDVSGDNIIVYSDAEELREKLDRRIKATVQLRSDHLQNPDESGKSPSGHAILINQDQT